MFIEAGVRGCVRAAALIAALTQSRSILLRADKAVEEERLEIFGTGTSDFFIHIRAFEWAKKHNFRTDACRPLAIHAEAARQVSQLFNQFLDIADAEGLDTYDMPASDETIARCILVAFADQVARRRNIGTLHCDIVHGRRGVLSRSSVAQNSRLLVAAEIAEIESRGGVETVLSMVTEIEESWLKEMFPEDFRERSLHVFDNTQNRVVVRSEVAYHDLMIHSRDRDAVPSPLTAACLAEEILNGDLRLNGWDDEAEQFILRLNFLAAAMPDMGFPAIDDTDRKLIIAEMCEGATCYRDVKDKPALPALRNWLAPAQVAQMEKFAPVRFALPGGRKAKITYRDGGQPPVLGARIQDLYGVEGGLTVAGGRVPLTIEVLAPNFRPIQITSDLKHFWAESYPAIKNQLQRRYPKHEWR